MAVRENIGIDMQDFVAVSQNDKSAFERLFKRYYGDLCDYARGFLEDRELGEDVVQDVFVYFWNHREQIDLKVSVKAYLYTAVRHGALNVIKRQMMERRHNPALTEFMEYLESQDYSEEEQTRLSNVKSAITLLPEQCRKVFLMSCVDGKKYQEIADELDISLNTVKTHVTKAYRIIRGAVGSKEMVAVCLFLMWQRWDNHLF